MKKVLSFDDVLITPQFSTIKSRANVDPRVDFLGEKIIPIISSNMDSVTGATMANAMHYVGAAGALHRFQSIEDNVKMFKAAPKSLVSLGLGDTELERAAALMYVGANKFIIDVAHGASIEVVKQTKALRHIIKDSHLVVGNFATGRSITDFFYHLGNKNVQALKVSVGSGSACTTRMVTGCGLPAFESIIDCRSAGVPIIADGGIRGSDDLCKAIGAGATVVMIGRLLAGTDESAAQDGPLGYKIYRGSASKESYEVQGKTASHRAPEGQSFFVPYSRAVADTITQLEAGLRSAMSYVGASNIEEFRERVEFVEITNGGAEESKPHGKE
jgi:IMP dehydrogenase